MAIPGAGEVRSEHEIERLRAERGGVWTTLRAVRRRRPILTALLVLAAPAHTLLMGARPVDLLSTDPGWRGVAAWTLMVLGVAIRIWGSGNLRKNQEITSTGVYAMVRHPLYTGSLAMFLAYFLTVGDLGVGLVLFVILVGLVYYPTMMGEEEYLGLKFPAQAEARRGLPRLLPDPRRLPDALRTDRFSVAASTTNLGLRSLGFVIGLPLFLRVLMALQH